MSNSSVGSSDGVSVLTVLGMVFVILKLGGVVDWSWWLVTMPLWGLPVAFIFSVIVCLTFLVVVDITKAAIRINNKEKQ